MITLTAWTDATINTVTIPVTYPAIQLQRKDFRTFLSTFCPLTELLFQGGQALQEEDDVS